MGRSLYGMLHRKFGTRISGAERVRRTRAYQERLRSVMPTGILDNLNRSTAPSSINVAVVGAGFAGCVAAYLLDGLGFNVTVYDPQGFVGGRVSSSTSVVSGRILETGAELIGINHPAWMLLSSKMAIPLGVVTPDDEFPGLESPLILQGISYNSTQQEQLYDQMNTVIASWISSAGQIDNPWAPWTVSDATTLDQQNLGAQFPNGTPQDVITVMSTDFELNNTVAIGNQSWLANLAQFNAGGIMGGNFWTDTEVFRCSAGNISLANALIGSLTLNACAVTAIDTSGSTSENPTATLTLANSNDQPTFNYVIVATPVGVWPNITVDGGNFPFASVSFGPAIKYLAPVASRFWLSQGLAPNGMSDVVGMLWEGTDNQDAISGVGFDLTVFSGGSAATNAISGTQNGTDAYFQPLVEALYPGFATTGNSFFENLNDNSNFLTGYSCPAPTEVTGAQQSYVSPYNFSVYVAGEHTSPAWFGFMEGALESGFFAAVRILQASGFDIPASWGGTSAL